MNELYTVQLWPITELSIRYIFTGRFHLLSERGRLFVNWLCSSSCRWLCASVHQTLYSCYLWGNDQRYLVGRGWKFNVRQSCCKSQVNRRRVAKIFIWQVVSVIFNHEHRSWMLRAMLLIVLGRLTNLWHLNQSVSNRNEQPLATSRSDGELFRLKEKISVITFSEKTGWIIFSPRLERKLCCFWRVGRKTTTCKQDTSLSKCKNGTFDYFRYIFEVHRTDAKAKTPSSVFNLL